MRLLIFKNKKIFKKFSDFRVPEFLNWLIHTRTKYPKKIINSYPSLVFKYFGSDTRIFGSAVDFWFGYLVLDIFEHP